MSLNPGKNLENKNTNNGFCIFPKSSKCLRTNTVNRIVGSTYVRYRSLSHEWWGTELAIKEMVLENKDTFPHRHSEREREDNYEKRIRRVKKNV